MRNTLLIINQQPSPEEMDKLNKKLKEWIAADINLNIFLTQDGVFWLNSQIWEKIYQPQCVFYASAVDAKRIGANFIPEVIFSGDKSLKELKENVDVVYQLEEI